MKADWKKISDSFPINEEKIWFNNCGVTPPPRQVLESQKEYLDEYARNLYLSKKYDFERLISRIKNRFCELLHASGPELTLIHNTAEGMNNIAMGVDFEKDDKVLLLEDEYPSNVYPWARLYKTKGVITQFVPMAKNPGLFLKNLDKAIDEKTRLISFSAVHWISGMPLPLEEIGEICRQKGIIFCVDGSQGVGMVPIDVKKMRIDFMAFSAWKWTMGPIGLGVFYITEEFYDKLTPAFIGTSSMVDEHNYLPYKQDLKPGADKYIFSTPSLNDWAHFDASTEFLTDLGWHNVRQRIYDLAGLLKEKLRKLEFFIPSDHFSEVATGIVSAKHPLKNNTLLAKALEEESIYTAIRKDYVRFSPHICNNEDQIEKIHGVLNSVIS